jgi:cellulose 1,4-beta-cellobiosidase
MNTAKILTNTTTRLLAVLVLSSIYVPSALAAAPPAPTGLTVTGPLETQLTLSWTASSGATGYNIYRGTSSGGESLTPLQSNVTSTTYEDAGLGYGQTYYYVVTALNGSQQSGPSNEASAVTKASVPATFTATAGDSQVVLNWSVSPTATSYKIYRDTLGGPGGATPIVVNGGATTTYTDTGLLNGTTYYYQIGPINPSGEDPNAVNPSTNQTIMASATPQAASSTEAPAGAPAGPVAVAGSGQVLLRWQPVSNATSYRVLRGTSSNSESALPPTVTSLTYVDSGLTNGTPYFYKVIAVNDKGGATSSPSTEVSATPYVPAAPSNLTATTASGEVVLSWTATGRLGDPGRFGPDRQRLHRLRGGQWHQVLL